MNVSGMHLKQSSELHGNKGKQTYDNGDGWDMTSEPTMRTKQVIEALIGQRAAIGVLTEHRQDETEVGKVAAHFERAGYGYKASPGITTETGGR